MFLRCTTLTKNGKTHTYWRLVRSVRIGGKVRQQTVCQLGELDEAGRLRARDLALTFLGPPRLPDWFDDPAPSDPITIDPKALRLERPRRFGDVWLAQLLWQALHFDRLFQELLPQQREDIPWSTIAAVLVFARFCRPQSELHIAESWYRQSALQDLLGVPPHKINDDRLYRALDRLIPHKSQIEAHIKNRLGTLFQLEYDLLLYDVTSTYFEGRCAKNPLAQRGYSRDHRSDCKQVCIGLVVTREGYPLGYEVFEGHRHDSKTVQQIVETMEQRYGRDQRIWAMDRGMVSEENLKYLREKNCRFIVGMAKSELKEYAERIQTGSWQTIREGLQVQRCDAGEHEVALLCRSEDRRAKEEAMVRRFEQRIEAGLSKLQASCEKKRQQVGVIERRVGRLLQQNARAAKLFKIEVKAETNAGAKIQWSKQADKRSWSEQSAGCYLLRTNVKNLTNEEIWKSYTQLTEAEAAFRIQKEELGLRPVWHQKEERVKAHIFVCFLAYALRKTLEGWMSRAGLGKSVEKVLEELGRIESMDVVLGTTDRREIKLRCVTNPDSEQKVLLDHLGLSLPKRLKFGEQLTKSNSA